jgi:glyoxylase-like metal-dependent hydrolase (beta-lactamase superfamily II)
MYERCLLPILPLAFACLAAPSEAQGPVAAAPAARSFDIGAARVTVLKAGRLAIPNDGSVFGLNARPSELAQILTRAGLPGDPIYLDIDVLLVRLPRHMVLIDAGYGENQGSVLGKSLRLLHLSRSAITGILITHAHPDHVGGLVDASGRPAFPKAAIRISVKDWSFMR